MGLDGSLIFVPTSYLVGEILIEKNELFSLKLVCWARGCAPADTDFRFGHPSACPKHTPFHGRKAVLTLTKGFECMNTKLNTKTTPLFDGFRPHPNSAAVFLLATTGPWTHLGNMI